MSHRLLVVRVRSQWPTVTAILSRDLHICPSSPLIWSEYTCNKPACRMYGTPTVGAPWSPKDMKSEEASSSSACTPMSPRNAEAKSSSRRRSGSANPRQKPKPELVIFHNPASPASVKLLAFLQSAQRAYPQTRRRIGPPLDFQLKVRESLPTAEELQDMYSLLNESSWTVFRARNSAGNYRLHPTSARSLLSGIELERQEQIAKANQKTYDSAVASESPMADSPPTELSNTEVPAGNFAVLDTNHPLFGTQTFAWPVLVYWHANEVFAGSRLKNVHRLLIDLANERDNIVVKSKEQIKEEVEKAKQANWTYPGKQVSPEEDDTLKWFNESGGKPVRKLSR